MPIRTRDPLLREAQTAAPESTFGEVFAAAAGESAQSGFGGAWWRSEELSAAEGSPSGSWMTPMAPVAAALFPRRPSPVLTPQDARQRLRNAGLDESLSVPESGIPEAALTILMDRKLVELRRQSILRREGAGLPTALLGGLAGSFVDPTNIALAFVPVVGSARYAAWLARAGGVAGRTGVRVGVGAVEGTIGLLPAEAMNYAANVQQQADYDAYDVMVSIAGGAAFGSALHGGAGLFADGFRAMRPKPVAPTVDPVTGAVRQVDPTAQMQAPDRMATERAYVLERLAEGKPVTRRQVEALAPRTGADAGRVIDGRLAELELAGRTGYLDEAKVAALVEEADELEALVRAQDKAAREGVTLSPGQRLTAEERTLADTRRVEIKRELEAHRTAQGARKQQDELLEKLGKIDRDGDLIALANKLSPEVREGEQFVESLSPAIRKALDADPFSGVRPFVATMQPETQAAAFRMAAAQFMRGEPVDVLPAVFSDPRSLSPSEAMGAARANAGRLSGADDAAARQADEFEPDKGEYEELVELFGEEKRLVDRLYAAAGREMDTADLDAINAQMKMQRAAADQATTCLLGGKP